MIFCTIVEIFQITNLFAWSANSRSAHRQQIRIILERLDKKIGYVVKFLLFLIFLQLSILISEDFIKSSTHLDLGFQLLHLIWNLEVLAFKESTPSSKGCNISLEKPIDTEFLVCWMINLFFCSQDLFNYCIILFYLFF